MRAIELFLVVVILAFGLWLWDDYIAFLITFILLCILCAVLLVAFLSEKIEKSRVPKRYFQLMWASIVALLVSGMVYALLFGFDLERFLG